MKALLGALKLLELRGIPAAGKTTMARTLVMKTVNTARVNKDDLRTMMFGNSYNPKYEPVVKAAEVAVAKACIEQGYNVIVDDTNLAADSLWRDLANDLKLDYSSTILNTPPEVAIVRDALRSQPVGAVVIRAAASKLFK